MVLALLQRWHYVGLFLALLAEEAGIPLPIPGDVFIAAMGTAGRAGHANFIATTVIVMSATLGGSAILFETSRRLGQPFLLRIGRRFGFDADRAVRVELWLKRRGAVAIVAGRLTPGLRIVVTVAAGALGVGRTQFLCGTAVASVLWSVIYYWLGYAFGAGVTTLLTSASGRALEEPHTAAIAITVLGLAVAAAVSIVTLRRRRARHRAPRA
ncbi:MAG TPA: DedA family protein [Gemmatimonadaceae bacterium]